ncbi:hypothetical protein C1B90_20475 [Salmonella enterica]|uniref:Fimbrial protein n=1 Tax=Salmonella enterica TaxID=28901 RepID=A0A5T4LMX3_SALER|nr:hypothetical protein [Salmonella enterica]EBL7518427.1 hypothetical protein [Salmonella enterica]
MSLRKKFNIFCVFFILMFPVFVSAESRLAFAFDDIRMHTELKQAEVISSRELFLDNPVDEKNSNWELLPLVNVLKSDASGSSIVVESDVAGIDISITKKNEGKNRIKLVVSLVKGMGNLIEGGRVNEQKSVAFLKFNNNVFGKIYVSANVYVAGCEVISGNIKMNLAGISVSDARSNSLSLPLNSGSGRGGINLMCNSGGVNELVLKFSTAKFNGNIIIPDEDSGVGFMLRNGLNNKWVRFDNDNAFNFVVEDSGRKTIPLEVFYSRYDDVIKPGLLSAKVQYTITYK